MCVHGCDKDHKKCDCLMREKHNYHGDDACKGVLNLPGPMGPAGAQGERGKTGPDGATGVSGLQGISGPVGPQGDTGPSGATGPQGPDGVTGVTGLGFNNNVMIIQTIMRTPSDPLLFGSIVGPITFTTPSLGTLTGTIGATESSIITYVPNIRIPRWPKLQAWDSFSFTGFNALGEKILTIVNVQIQAVSPSDRYIAVDFSSNLIGVEIPGSTAVGTLLKAGFGDNLATNNVDGIVFSRENGSTNRMKFWDPVSNLTGQINIGNILNFTTGRPLTSGFGATFDNDRCQLYFAMTNAGVYNSCYRMSFLPYVTGTTPIIKSIDNVFLLSNPTLTTILPNEVTDIAWDPNSKKMFVGIQDLTNLLHTTPYDMRFLSVASGGGVIGSNALECFSQPTNIGSGATMESPGMTFTNDGKIFYVHTRYNGNIYIVDPAPTTATVTLVSNLDTIPSGVIDISTWPATLAV